MILVSLLDIGSAEGSSSLKEYRRFVLFVSGEPDRPVIPRENRKLSEMYIDYGLKSMKLIFYSRKITDASGKLSSPFHSCYKQLCLKCLKP